MFGWSSPSTPQKTQLEPTNKHPKSLHRKIIDVCRLISILSPLLIYRVIPGSAGHDKDNNITAVSPNTVMPVPLSFGPEGDAGGESVDPQRYGGAECEGNKVVVSVSRVHRD